MSITDVAKEAGVSVATVSRVMNGSLAVRPATARRVREAMDALGYAPSRVRPGPRPKRDVARVRSGAIGLVLIGRPESALSEPYIARQLGAVLDRLQPAGWSTRVYVMSEPADAASYLGADTVDGLLVFSGRDVNRWADVFHPTPVVWMGGTVPQPLLVDHVTVDHESGARLAASYLLERGCVRPAQLNPDPSHPSLALRFRCFDQAIVEAGLPVISLVPTTPAGADADRRENLRSALRQMLDELVCREPNTDGIFCAVDEHVAVLYSLLRERGIEPGHGLITISCNGDQPWLRHLQPRPATVDLHPDQIGCLAVDRLVARIDSPGAPPVCIQTSPSIVPGDV